MSIWGRDIDERPRDARAAIGVVPQEIAADPFFTPREALDVAAGMYAVPKAERRTDAIIRRAPDAAPSAAFLGKALAGAPSRARRPVLSPWMVAGATAAVLVVAVSASWQIQHQSMMRDADEAVELLITDIGDHS